MKNAQESLNLIKSLVEDNRKLALGSGMPSIIWGVFVIIALSLTYWGVHRPMRTGWYYLLVWVIASSLGFTISYLIERQREKFTVSTFSQQLLGVIWLAQGVAMMILAFVASLAGVLNLYAISPIMGTLLGSAYFINGHLNQYKWLKVVGVLWWISSIALFFLVKVDVYGGSNTLLYFAGLMFLLQVVPGLKLESQWRKENR
ncbi:MAG: hypothetical protein APR54_10510 [Candidatus Cloacimonas sp. SDB]|nr:MAG: hypothetical protein APR54_10510 [Candidatus Cloacimonas sp. SDB]